MLPRLFFISTGGHLLFLILFLLEIHLSQAGPRSAYSVSLVSPAPEAGAESAVFPKPDENDRATELELTGTMLVEREPEPLPESGPAIPPGLADPKDCLLKKVADICPGADLSCIAGYVAYCVRLS
jgi:hypothetical protein